AAKLLRDRYPNEKALAELKRFISKEHKKGAQPEEIIAELVQEGWDHKIIKAYVIAHYQ
ncbi:hypothetical protein HYV87_05560, partial [Candidatus Woesearchaeota archaeon]|nr:hypothetical protein [Candidatus Woesearchaeota archaeon]